MITGAGAAGETPAGETGGDEEEDTDLFAEPAAKRDDKEYKRGPYKSHKRSYDKGGRIKNYKNIATTRDWNRQNNIALVRLGLEVWTQSLEVWLRQKNQLTY